MPITGGIVEGVPVVPGVIVAGTMAPVTGGIVDGVPVVPGVIVARAMVPVAGGIVEGAPVVPGVTVARAMVPAAGAKVDGIPVVPGVTVAVVSGVIVTGAMVPVTGGQQLGLLLQQSRNNNCYTTNSPADKWKNSNISTNDNQNYRSSNEHSRRSSYIFKSDSNISANC